MISFLLVLTFLYFGGRFMNYLIDFILAKILFRPNFDGVNREDMTLISNETNNEVTQEIEINTTDGIKLRALYTVAKTNIDISQRKCILYSHGNMGNIYGENKKEHMLRKIVSDVDILTYDYKGYGKNLGKSTERGIYEDIMNVWYHMVYNLKYEPKNIILYGYSLGCVPTLWLANEVHACNHIVIQAGFSSLEDVVKEITSSDNLQYLCKLLARHMLHKKFNNVERIKSIGNKVPITIFHSIEDDLIQFNCTNTLKKANPYVNVYKTLGSHSIPIYDEPSEEILRKILS